jgi:antitoxin component of MazEF toxin-antitoxin module
MEFIRKINKTAKRSYGVVIPKEFIKKLNWKERQKLVLSLRGKTIRIKDWQKK